MPASPGPDLSSFFVLAVCAFASSFSLRLLDPLVLPMAQQFGIAPSLAALVGPAYALPYALAQPFLGPVSDRLGRARCIRACIAGLALALLLGWVAPGFHFLVATRIAAGVFGGGLVPLVLASLGDAHAMATRQMMIGRMLVFIIGGQMAGSVVAGLVSAAFGWRSALGVGALLAVAAALAAWTAAPAAASGTSTAAVTPTAAPTTAPPSFRALYGQVFANPKAPWLFGCVFAEGLLFFGFFPHMGELLALRDPAPAHDIASRAGLVLGAFGIGGLVYALTVQRLISLLGVRRLCLTGTLSAIGAHLALAGLHAWWQAALAMGVAGLAFYMVHNALQTEATELAPGARGSAVATFAASLFLGQGLGPVLVGLLVPAIGLAPAFMAVACALALLGTTVLARVVLQRAAGPLRPQ